MGIMSRERLYGSEAVVIKRTDLGEADKILTVYTPNKGKFRVVAKGVRRPISKLGGHVELFTQSKMLFAKGRNLDIVTQSETVESFRALRQDLNRISHAYYVAELLDRFTEDCIENYPIYKLLLEILQRLSEDRDPGLVVRYYELRLLGYLGYRPQLQQCVACHQSLNPVTNFFSPRGGGMLCPDCRHTQYATQALSVDALKVLRFLQSNNLSAINRLRVEPKLSFELETVMRYYIRYLLERDVKSADWLDSLRGQTKQPVLAH